VLPNSDVNLGASIADFGARPGLIGVEFDFVLSWVAGVDGVCGVKSVLAAGLV
jgi:hypothetical protein